MERDEEERQELINNFKASGNIGESQEDTYNQYNEGDDDMIGEDDFFNDPLDEEEDLDDPLDKD